MATKRDLDVLGERLDARFDVVVERMATKDDLQSLQRSVVTWLLTAQATVVATIGLLLVALR